MNPYNIDLSDTNLQWPLASLEVLYDGMPKTHGCDGCPDANGENKDWCCKKQAPSMYYVEFLYVFKHVQQEWRSELRRELLLEAIRCYLDNRLNKGCVFYMGSGCDIHKYRPFVCHQYGVIPKANWDKRWKTLKARQGDKFEALPQCNLVFAEKEITAAQEDKWFEHIKSCEARIGVMPARIELHDEAGGSYRTFHDHLLLEMLGDGVLTILSEARMTNPSQEDINTTVEEMRNLVSAKTLCS